MHPLFKLSRWGRSIAWRFSLLFFVTSVLWVDTTHFSDELNQMKRLFYCNIFAFQVLKSVFLVFRPLQHSGKCGMTSRFGMETRIHSVKCYESKEACRLSLTHRSVGPYIWRQSPSSLIGCCCFWRHHCRITFEVFRIQIVSCNERRWNDMRRYMLVFLGQ